MVISRIKNQIVFAFTVVMIASFATLSAIEASPYYEGKNITVLVGHNAGGGTDTTARILTKHFGKYIAGNPSVIVKNVPGAGGVKAMNLIAEKTRPDGYTIIFQNWTPISQLIEEPGVRFTYKDLTMISGCQGPPIMLFARVDTVSGGIKHPTDIVKADRLVYAGLRPSIPLDLFGRLSLELLDLDYRYVTGYRGAAKVRAAIKQGEANITTHALIGYRSGVEPTMVKDGTVTPLWYFQNRDEQGNYFKSKDINDMPTFAEIHEQIKGKTPSGDLWNAFNMVRGLYSAASWFFWGPPEMNEEATAALREGFQKLMQDPELKDEMQKIIGFVFKPVSTISLQKMVNDLDKADRDTIAYLKRFIADATKK